MANFIHHSVRLKLDQRQHHLIAVGRVDINSRKNAVMRAILLIDEISEHLE
jgi:hypothetical protein